MALQTVKAEVLSIKKYDVVELKKIEKGEKRSFLEKGISKKPHAIVLSNSSYNNGNTKTVLVAPVILKEGRKYKGEYRSDYIIEVKVHNKEYLIFVDKIRSLPKDKIEKISFPLPVLEQEKVRNSFNGFTN